MAAAGSSDFTLSQGTFILTHRKDIARHTWTRETGLSYNLHAYLCNLGIIAFLTGITLAMLMQLQAC